jgi:hypothetical protein
MGLVAAAEVPKQLHTNFRLGEIINENYKRTQNAGDLSEGPHPFSFRTRQLSLLEPMVLARGE